ncbi:MAG: hypothetical protein H7832_11365 [Magnetococcus sp. DMHC-6]
MPGKRTAEHCLQVVEEVQKRTGGRTDLLLTSDEYAPYQTAIKRNYATEELQPKRPGPGRPPKPKRVMHHPWLLALPTEFGLSMSRFRIQLCRLGHCKAPPKIQKVAM